MNKTQIESYSGAFVFDWSNLIDDFLIDGFLIDEYLIDDVFWATGLLMNCFFYLIRVFKTI